MASLAWKLRVYWKRCTFAAAASVLVAKYTAKKVRENNIIRAYCNQAKRYGEERVVSAERDGKPGRARKMMLFLNPSANRRDAKIQFLKYSAPLLHLSGADMTIVESQSEGHLRSLMNYIDPQTDCIVVAGGDGTLMEVLTGLMRRTDAEVVRSIPIGVIPLGRENRFYQSNLSPTGLKSQVRTIGDATMDIIRGEKTTPMHLMEIKPESGRLLYALSSVQWGPLRDAYENRDGFRLFGKLRLFFSHINVALRRWPTDYTLHVWYPRDCQLQQDSGSQPPSSLPTTTTRSDQTTPPDPSQSTTELSQGKGSLLKKAFTPVEAHCIRPRYSKETEVEEKKSSSSSSHRVVSETLEPTTLASGELEHKELKVMGFGLALQTGRGEGRGENGSPVGLDLKVWLDGSIHRAGFVKKGWLETMGGPPSPLPCLSVSSPHLVLQPHSNSESWVSIDGEVYETMPVSVTAVPSAFRVYTGRKQ